VLLDLLIDFNMPLASLAPKLAEARNGGYGVCYCESWNLESFQAVVQRGKNAGRRSLPDSRRFCGNRSRSKPERTFFLCKLEVRTGAVAGSGCLLLNESDSQAQIRARH